MDRVSREPPPQLEGEGDRSLLKGYLERRLKALARAKKRAGEREEVAFFDGAEVEIYLIFDELLRLQAPEPKRRAPRAM